MMPATPATVVHDLLQMLGQRVYGICLGYEDCNDFQTLRHQRHARRPRRVVLDLDLTDDPTYGQQELSFFRSHYGEHVYLPLLVFDERGDLITVVLLPGNVQGPKVLAPLVRRILRRLRMRWPGIPALVRGDSGMAGPEMYAVCRQARADFVLGLQVNSRLKQIAARLQEQARRRYLRTHAKVRLFRAIRYRARRRWPCSYRVVIKAEHHDLGPNVRFVVTTLGGSAQSVYDGCYVQRAEASVRRVWFHLSSHHPWRALWLRVARQLGAT